MNARQRRKAFRAEIIRWARARAADRNPGILYLKRGRCLSLRRRMGVFAGLPRRELYQS